MNSTYALVFILFTSLISAGSEIALKKIEPHMLEKDPQFENVLKSVFTDAFHAVYTSEWDEPFEKFALDLFDHYIKRFKAEPESMMLNVAFKDNAISGWALFAYHDHDAVLELICVHPDFWRQGIGKKLVFSIRDYCPEINHIALVSRKKNTISPSFYTSLGFKETGFTLPEYTDIADTLRGFEWYASE